MSLKDRLKGKKRLGQPLEVPEWSETVHVRKLSAREVLDFRAWVKEQETAQPDEVVRNVDTLVRLVMLAVVDQQGDPLFDASDRPWLEDADQGALERIFKAVMTQSSQTESAREDIRKNSETAAGASLAALRSSLANGAPAASSVA